MSYPAIYGIEFSDDDVGFMDDQAEKQNMLKFFVAILALDQVTEISTRFMNYKSLRDLIQPVTGTVLDVTTSSWDDAAQGILQIEFSMAIMDTNLHLQGRYMSYGTKFAAPKGKARQFFIALAAYYSDLSGRL